MNKIEKKFMPQRRFTTVAIFAARLALEHVLRHDQETQESIEQAQDVYLLLRGCTESFSKSEALGKCEQRYMILNFKFVYAAQHRPLDPRLARVIVQSATGNDWQPTLLRLFRIDETTQDFAFLCEEDHADPDRIMVSCEPACFEDGDAAQQELRSRLNLSRQDLDQWLI